MLSDLPHPQSKLVDPSGLISPEWFKKLQDLNRQIDGLLTDLSSSTLTANLDANGFNVLFDDNTGLLDDSGNEQLIFQKTANAVNHVELTNAATGNAPVIGAAGSNTNIDLVLAGKGTGVPKVGASAILTAAALAAEVGVSIQAYDAQLSSLIRQNSQSAAYTTVLTDGGKHILHPSSDNNPRTFTIDSNANVAYPIGTAITFVNQINTVTIAITSDTLTLAGLGTTGSRTLAANGIATAVKVGSTSWVISGVGLS